MKCGLIPGRLSENGYPRNTQRILAVEIPAFLDLDQISADFEIEHSSKVSMKDSEASMTIE